ncbi:MAG TPA: transposase DNA-binding-containing protein, partial [Bacteriovoracaceae bacterium]|nr:transposase DNA-binding-containing protein [Bacteriovoracaceae bacterium]
MTPSNWAVEELSKVNFGDKRLDRRFLKVAGSQALAPLLSINASSADWSCAKGAYRLFDNPKVTHEKILDPHIENTVHRIYGQELVVIAQDTTFVDFSSHEMTTGLGIINKLGEQTKGVHFHAGLAMSHEGTPLGLLYSNIWTRLRQTKLGHQHTKIPINKKESYRWIQCLEQTKAHLPSGTRALVVADRECDIYEYFECAQDLDLDVLVRLQH